MTVTGALRIVPVLTSWVSLATAVAAFTKARRNKRDGASPATLKNMIFDLLWRLAETGGRVVAIALFATAFRFYVLPVLIPHVLLMLCWYIKKDVKNIFKQIAPKARLLADLLCAYLSLFTFVPRTQLLVNITMPYSRIRYLVFYALFYSENVAMVLAWYFTTPDGSWLHTAGLVAVLTAFPLHVALQVLYYAKCHPHPQGVKREYSYGDTKPCLPRNKNTWKRELWDIDD